MAYADIEKKRAADRHHAKLYALKHPDEVAARKALWYQVNKQRRRQVQKAYRDAIKREQAEQAVKALEDSI